MQSESVKGPHVSAGVVVDEAEKPLVLVIDDAETIRKVARMILSEAGFRPLCAANEREAIAFLEQYRDQFAAILYDMFLPGGDGDAFLRHLREYDGTAQVPVIVMSTKGDVIPHAVLRSRPVADHLTKPFSPSALVALVSHVVAKSHRGGYTTATYQSPLFDPLAVSESVAQQEEIRGWMAARISAVLSAELAVEPVQTARILEKTFTMEMLERFHDAYMTAAGSPALSGDLSVFPFAEVLQLLNLQHMSGLLHISHGKAAVDIYLRDGLIDFVQAVLVGEQFLLGHYLIREGIIAPADMEVFLENRQGTTRLLGEQLIMLGYVTRQQLIAALRQQSSEIVYELIRWGRGKFRFHPFTAVYEESGSQVRLKLSPAELLMEGFRRIDEWRLMEGAIGDFGNLPKQLPPELAGLRRSELTDNEQAVLTLIDGEKDVNTIIREAQKAPFDVLKIIYRLVKARVVMVAARDVADAAATVADPQEKTEP